jgi:uncharacterized protein YcbK (DUF882 family)
MRSPFASPSVARRGFRLLLTGRHVTGRVGRNRSLLGQLSYAGLRIGLASLFILAGGRAVHDATASNETRTLSFHHTHSDENFTITFKRNGRYDDDALRKLNHYLRDWRTQDETLMDRHLFDILWEVYRDVDAKQPIQIISSYRSPATNAMLHRRSSGVARHSQHMLGHAMDFSIPGVPLEEIRFAGLRLQRGGVGFYPTSGSPFVHLDTGSVRHWPRMTHDQLARVFPDGRTVHIPSDGVPLKGYELALADIERRGGSSDSAAGTPKAKNFLASLFGKTDDEDEGSAIEPTPKVTTVAADATATASTKPASVPMPRMRPAIYQVASATNDMPAAKSTAKSGATQSIADIINSRGLWGDDKASKQPTEALKAASLKARFAATFAEASPSANNVEVKPWSADDKAEAKPQTLAFATPTASLTERVRIVTASAPIPRSVRPVPSAPPVKIDTVVSKGVQPVPTNLTRVDVNQRAIDPWTRATMLAPNFHYAMLATMFGDRDMTLMRAMFAKPDVVVLVTFAEDPTPGMSCMQFSGSSIAMPQTVSFRTPTQTAALQQ